MNSVSYDVSIVICAYTEKRWNEIVAAVTSVQHQTLPAKDIIVVIDHNPALLKRVQEDLPGITVLENRGNKGLSGARNTGWAAAQGEIVAFLDDDAIAAADWVENLIACYGPPEVVGVGGKIIPLWKAHRPSWFPHEFNWVVGCTYLGLPLENARIRNLIGANMSMRKSVLETVGGFRESFGWNKSDSPSQSPLKWFNHIIGDEETELCIRVSQQLSGSVWLYATSAIVQHQVTSERARWAYFVGRCYDEGLGKACLARLHNSSLALSAERDYTFKVLPGGVARGMADTFLRSDPTGLLRAGAIVAGLAITATGYLVGRVTQRLG